MLGVTVSHEDSEPVGAEIIDVSIDGAGISLPAESDLVLEVEQQVDLVFTSPKLQASVALQGIIRSRRELDDGRLRYGLRFEPSGHLQTLLESELFRVFNQRGAYRVELEESEPIDVQMRAVESDSGEVAADAATARLKDISATGMGILVDRDVNVRFEGAALLELSFTLPDVRNELRVVAYVRNRRPIEDLYCYGLEFDEQRSNRFVKQQDDILDFVMRRQRQALATRVR